MAEVGPDAAHRVGRRAGGRADELQLHPAGALPGDARSANVWRRARADELSDVLRAARDGAPRCEVRRRTGGDGVDEARGGQVAAGSGCVARALDRMTPAT